MSKKALVEVDSRIARIQREVADGQGSQIAQVEICELLNERTKLLSTLTTSGEREAVPAASGGKS
jgi:hypothetical protein